MKAVINLILLLCVLLLVYLCYSSIREDMCQEALPSHSYSY